MSHIHTNVIWKYLSFVHGRMFVQKEAVISCHDLAISLFRKVWQSVPTNNHFVRNVYMHRLHSLKNTVTFWEIKRLSKEYSCPSLKGPMTYRIWWNASHLHLSIFLHKFLWTLTIIERWLGPIYLVLSVCLFVCFNLFAYLRTSLVNRAMGVGPNLSKMVKYSSNYMKSHRPWIRTCAPKMHKSYRKMNFLLV